MSVNRMTLVGNVGVDPELRYLPDGTAVANLSVATSEVWKDKAGVKQERTEWHRVVVYGRLAEVAKDYVHKGSQLFIEGKLRTRKWSDKAGVERYSTEIVGSELQMLGRKLVNEAGTSPASDGDPMVEFEESEVPF